MIIQQNPERPNLAVTVDENNPALLCVAEHELPNGAVVQAATFDLTPHQGSPFRLYVEEDGRLEPALDGVHYWLLAEVMVPEKRMETREVPGAKARNRTPRWWNSRSICGKWISLFIRGRNLWSPERRNKPWQTFPSSA